MGIESEAQACLGIDATFIQSPEHRPNAKYCDFTKDQIPLIDLSPLKSTTPPHPSTLDSLVAQIHAACRDWGFFQVINHGVAPHLLHTVQSMEKLAFRLLELIARSLGLPADYFNSKFEEQTSAVRLNHYSPCPVPELALGVGRHKDPGALTVLAQDDVGGLQVKRKDGEWIGVKPIPDSFVINVGDCMQVWSNDKYKSVEHRVVVNDKKERFSVPLFLNPSHYVMVGPVPDLVNEKNPPRYREYCWGKFVRSRRHSNFKNLGTENIQIHHFKIS